MIFFLKKGKSYTWFCSWAISGYIVVNFRFHGQWYFWWPLETSYWGTNIMNVLKIFKIYDGSPRWTVGRATSMTSSLSRERSNTFPETEDSNEQKSNATEILLFSNLLAAPEQIVLGAYSMKHRFISPSPVEQHLSPAFFGPSRPVWYSVCWIPLDIGVLCQYKIHERLTEIIDKLGVIEWWSHPGNRALKDRLGRWILLKE